MSSAKWCPFCLGLNVSTTPWRLPEAAWQSVELLPVHGTLCSLTTENGCHSSLTCVSVWSGLQTYVAVDCHGSHSSTPAAPHALWREEEPELWRTISWLSAVPPQIRWDWHFTQLIPVMFVPETFISGNHHENDPFNKWAKTLLKWLVRIHQ